MIRLYRVQDGTKILSGGADNAGRMYDVTTGQAQQVAQHDAPIKVVKWIETPQGGILATGSWDKTIKVWDLAARAAVSTIQESTEVWAVSWQPASGAGSGGAFVTGGEDGMVKWWRAAGTA